MTFNWNVEEFDRIDWKKMTADCTSQTVDEKNTYHTLVAFSFEKLIHKGLWRTLDKNREPVKIEPIWHMEPTNMRNILANAKENNNYLIINAIEHAYNIIEQKANKTLSKLNNAKNMNNTNNTNNTSNPVAIKSDTETKTKAKSKSKPLFKMGKEFKCAGNDNKIIQCKIGNVSETEDVNNNLIYTYKYRVKGENGVYGDLRPSITENMLLEKIEHAKELGGRGKDKGPRDTAQYFHVGEIYKNIKIISHKPAYSLNILQTKIQGKKVFTDFVKGHSYEVVTVNSDGSVKDGTVKTYTQAQLKKRLGIKKGDKNEKHGQMSLNLEFSENSRLRAENAELKKFMSDINKKLDMLAARNG